MARFGRPSALVVAILLLGLVALFALGLGRYPIDPRTVLRALGAEAGLMAPPANAIASQIVMDVRLPRIVIGMLVGAILSLSGAAYQAVFRNPLVSPAMLGVLAGAGFGMALAILLSLPAPLRLLFAFLGGGAAVAVGVAIAISFGGVGKRVGDGGILLLVFGGLVSTALFNALLSMIKFVADPSNQLPDIVFWLLGSFANADLEQIEALGPYMLASIVGLLWIGRYLDLLAIGEDEARSLGAPVGVLRMTVIAIATIASALTVAAAGTIGWVGLIVPHIARLIVGPSHRLLMPICACLGGIFILIADTLARSVTASEIPIGIVADLLGVLLFLCVLPRVRRGWA